MLNLSNSDIEELVIHQVGNKFHDGELILSEASVALTDEDMIGLLKGYFLAPFKREAWYNFIPYEDDFNHNPVYQAVNKIFNGENLYEASLLLAEHLYEQSNRPDVRSGELYIVHFCGCQMDEGICDAVGIFKSENKETFLKIFQEEKTFQLQSDHGVSIKKLDKACLVFNIDSENGYRVLVADKSNAKESLYWVTDFLGLEHSNDSYFQTMNYLNLCKDFVKDIYNRENDVPRADQIDMLNRSFNFFKQSELFSESDFIEKVVQKPEVINAFENFKQEYVQNNQLPVVDSFKISDFAVKDEKRFFKHVLKLDKNFHVYIHGQRKYLEKGYDTARDMNYYKLYFREEE